MDQAGLGMESGARQVKSKAANPQEDRPQGTSQTDKVAGWCVVNAVAPTVAGKRRMRGPGPRPLFDRSWARAGGGPLFLSRWWTTEPTKLDQCQALTCLCSYYAPAGRQQPLVRGDASGFCCCWSGWSVPRCDQQARCACLVGEFFRTSLCSAG